MSPCGFDGLNNFAPILSFKSFQFFLEPLVTGF
jgi:hypothetical protein